MIDFNIFGLHLTIGLLYKNKNLIEVCFFWKDVFVYSFRLIDLTKKFFSFKKEHKVHSDIILELMAELYSPPMFAEIDQLI